MRCVSAVLNPKPCAHVRGFFYVFGTREEGNWKRSAENVRSAEDARVQRAQGWRFAILLSYFALFAGSAVLDLDFGLTRRAQRVLKELGAVFFFASLAGSAVDG